MKTSLTNLSPRLSWLQSPSMKPYVYVRPENRVAQPGKLHQLDWFPQEPVYKNPLEMDLVRFADDILRLETLAFDKSNMAMPRWVFYDCAIVPGFVAGFAHRTKDLPPQIRKNLGLPSLDTEWTPISLFIIIPTMARREWVAHNLCSVNSIAPPEEKFYGLGFLTKAFGLWYANVEVNLGMTQWDSPAVKLHSHYGHFEVLTAFTPVHSYPRTLTYRLRVEPSIWRNFFTNEEAPGFTESYETAGFSVVTRDVDSLKQFQKRIEKGEGPFFLDSKEIRSKSLGESYRVYKKPT